MSNTKLTQEQFIERCYKTQGDQYDYSSVKYKDAITKVIIKCNTCSHVWNIIPGNFTHNKNGCPNCKNIHHQKRMDKTRISQETFINRCIQVHDNKYDYSKTIFTGVDNKITIICPDHSEFSQIAYDHSHGIGCNECRVNRLLQTKISKGMIRDPKDIPEYELYFNKVWYQTEKSFRKYKDIINPNNLERGYDYNLDHIFSVQQGFHNTIPSEIIGHYTNLRLIPALQNQQKHIRCDKTKEQLIEDYNNSI